MEKSIHSDSGVCTSSLRICLEMMTVNPEAGPAVGSEEVPGRDSASKRGHYGRGGQSGLPAHE